MSANNDFEYRILVVDDDEILNGLFCAFLGSRGFETLPALSVQEAKTILQTDGNIDIVLLDYQLGDGVGLDLFAEEVVPSYKNFPPVIMISANEEPEFLEQCFHLGVSDYIIKPVNLSLLSLKVKSLIASLRLQKIVNNQNVELEIFKHEAEREEAIAKFTYEYLVAQNSQQYSGINQYLKSCSSFSGDISITRQSPAGDIYFILADATGHGLSAAITIMPVVSLFNTMVSKGFHLQQIVSEINRKLVNDTPADRFVSATVVELNFAANEMSVWNGAMPPAYWLDNGKIIQKFPSRNMALGILSENMFDADVTVFNLPETGRLFLCSDGVIEQENQLGEQFSYARLESILCQAITDPTQDVLRALELHAQGVSYSDDVSICCLNPQEIRNGLGIEKSNNIEDYYHQIHPFSWSISISGNKLANADIPPMANNFLQYIGMDQKTCQKVFSIISEMISNALDHGILGMSSDLKQNPEGFMDYFLQREELLKNLTEKDAIELRLDWALFDGEKHLMISCRDTGPGYDFQSDRKIDNQKYSGRGVALIRTLARDVEIYAPGNFIKAIL
ncbi:MAG: SpoIIE family protein phosphatase [Cellvibrio sp.]|nr:SpoIIE family protein phosphatase [Cellvibrio sp.]